jgi:hypothetical protein
MLLGMMVVGASAAGFPDVEDTHNVEAIEVLKAVDVMVGDDKGNFGPDQQVSRAQMAVVMAKLLNLDYNYYQGQCKFTDVPNWAAPYVAACYANGIVSGYNDTTYGANDDVTAVQAASMMMRALGYFKYKEDYQPTFELATVKQASEIGIFSQVNADAKTPLTRNQVAQMALNALRTEMVTFTGTPGFEANGVTVGYKAEYTQRTGTEAKYNAIEGRTSDVASDANHKGQYYIQLGEQLYDGDLRLNNRATDDFGRPSRYWEYDGKAIGTYMKKELLRQEWTTEVTGKDFYDELGADTIKNYTFDITIDGVAIDAKTGSTEHNTVFGKSGDGAANSGKPYFDETFMAKTYKSGVGQTGKGVLTQVFVNPNTEEVDIAVINTYLAKAVSDYNTKRDEVSLDVYGLTSTGTSGNEVFYKYVEACKADNAQSKKLTVSSEDFAVEDMKKDDIVLVTQANGEIKTLEEPEVIADATLSSFSKYKYVINEGTQYDYNTTIDYDPDTLENYTGINGSQQLKNTSYNLYLDPYGYLIGVDVVEATRNYIFLTGIDQGTSNLNNKVSDAAGILLDGTFVNFEMNMIDSRTAEQATNANPSGAKTFKGHPLWNTWCTYTVDKNGVYTLKEVKNAPNFTTGNEKAGQWHDLTANPQKIDTKRVALKAGTTNAFAYGNDDSVYLVAEVKTVAARDKVLTGFKNPNDGTAAAIANDIQVGADVVIVSGVESRGTGIDTVSLETWTVSDIMGAAETNTTDSKAWPGNIYTLYDDDNYIIGAVVIGEDTGASKSLVYVNSSNTKLETYDRDEDEYTWVREVIADGVSTDLTEKGSGLSKLESMTQNTWYEVTYKADGSVKAVNRAYYSESGKNIGGKVDPASNGHTLTIGWTSNFTNANFTDNVNYLESMNVDGKSTYLYEEVWGLGDDAGSVSTGTVPTYSKTVVKTAMGENNQPSLVGGTLYVDTNAKKGLYVASDVKSVLIQKNDGKETTTYGENRDDLREMLDDLNYDNNSYLFKISAIVKDGRATVVVIHDWNETDARGNDKDRPGSSDEEEGDVNIYVTFKANGTVIGTEVKVPKALPADGRVRLTADDLTGKVPTGYHLNDSTLPKTVTLTGKFAEVDVVIERDTRDLTMPNGWKATWTADTALGIPAETSGLTATTAEPTVKVPLGATVTVTPADTDADANHYLYNPCVAEAKRMGAGANGATVATAWGDFEMTDDAELKADKYVKVAITAAATNNATTGLPSGTGAAYESATFGAALADTENGVTVVNSVNYVKSGDSIKVTLTCDAAHSDNTKTAAAVKVTGTVTGETGITATVPDIAAGTTFDADNSITVTVAIGGATGTSETATIAIAFAD